MANPTWTQIANAALTRINERHLVSISDTGAAAERIRALNDDIAREVLEAHDWASATKRQALTAIAGTVVGLYQLQYGLPADHVRTTAVLPLSIADDGTISYGPKEFDDWRVESDRILVGRTDLSTRFPVASGVALVYVAYDEALIGRWSPTLRSAVAALLAHRLAVGTVGSTQMAEAAYNDYQRLLNTAQRLDTYREGAWLQRYNSDDQGYEPTNYSSLAG